MPPGGDGECGCSPSKNAEQVAITIRASKLSRTVKDERHAAALDACRAHGA